MRFHIPLAAPLRLATITVAGVLVAGCGEDTQGASPAQNRSPSESPSSGGGETEPETELTVEVYLDESGDTDFADDDFEPGTWTLTCSPVGGDHPDPEAACAAVEEAGAEGFAEVPATQMCTEIYGGPQRADVSGHVSGTEIDTEFNRSGGCEIDRYDAMDALVAP